jgi:hypothetical protein
VDKLATLARRQRLHIDLFREMRQPAESRLYQIEGKAFVAGGQAEADALRFQQSLDFS